MNNSEKNLVVTGVPQLVYKSLYETGTLSCRVTYTAAIQFSTTISYLLPVQASISTDEEIRNATQPPHTTVHQKLISAQGSMQLQYCPKKQRKFKHGGHNYLGSSIYGISVMFAYVITSDTPIITVIS